MMLILKICTSEEDADIKATVVKLVYNTGKSPWQKRRRALYKKTGKLYL